MGNAMLFPGLFVTDQIARSSDPEAQAIDYAGKCKDHGFGWLALQIAEGNLAVAEMTKRECNERGVWFFTWAQGLDAADEKANILLYGSQGHVCNPENEEQDEEYDNAFLDWLVSYTEHRAVIWIEGAFGRFQNINPDQRNYINNPAVVNKPDYRQSQRWRDRQFVSMPEAFMPQDTNWTPIVMWILANDYGWHGGLIAPCIGIYTGPRGEFHAPPYTNYVNPNPGFWSGTPHWSIWNAGGMNDADWAAVDHWQRTVLEPAPPTNGAPPPSGQTPDELAGLIGDALQAGPPLSPLLARAVVEEVVKNSRRGYDYSANSRVELGGKIFNRGNTDKLWVPVQNKVAADLFTIPKVS